MRNSFAKPLAGHAYHRKSDAELHYIIEDAGAARQCVAGFDIFAECKYADQVNDACTILHYRRNVNRKAA